MVMLVLAVIRRFRIGQIYEGIAKNNIYSVEYASFSGINKLKIMAIYILSEIDSVLCCFMRVAMDATASAETDITIESPLNDDAMKIDIGFANEIV